MTNQPGFKLVIEKVVQRVQGFFQQFKIAPDTQEHPLHTNSSKPQAFVPYNGAPLEVGNELLITDDIIKLNSRLSNARGRVVIIDEMPTSGHIAVKASAFGIQINVDLPMAEHMRQAYISRQQAWSST